MIRDCDYDIRDFLPASFKGVPFPVSNVSDTGGRRGAVGEFLFSENTDYVDLGVKANQFSLSGVFSGKYHLENSRLFFEACKSSGAGVLLHPIRGVLSVACTRIELNNDLFEGINTTAYRAEFVETPFNLTFENIFKTIASLEIAGFVRSFVNSFGEGYNFHNRLWFEQDEVVDVLGKTIGVLQGAYETTSVASSTTKWEIVQNLHKIDVRDLATNGKDIGIVLYNAVAYIFRDDYNDTAGQVELCRNLLNSVAFECDYRNSNLIVCYIRILLLSKLLSLYKNDKDLLASDLLSIIELLDTIFNEELAVLQEFSFFELFDLVFKFRIETLKFFYKLFYSSKAKITYNFNSSVPPLVAAWEIYRDATKADDLRNNNETNNLAMPNDVEAIV